MSAGEFSGPVVLLSPSFSRKDESIFPRALDRLSRVFGHLPYSLMLVLIGPAFEQQPSARREFLVNELKKNDPRFLRAQTRSYLAYLDRHGSLAKRFCDASVRAWVVFGEKDDIGLAPAERELLTAAPNVTLVGIADTGHRAQPEAWTRSQPSFFRPLRARQADPRDGRGVVPTRRRQPSCAMSCRLRF